MPGCVRYPAPGCIVEYMEGNAVQIAMVTEEAGGRLRLLLPNRRETRLTAARLLPWLGPQHAADAGREEVVRLLETHRKAREEMAAAVPVMEVWEMAQGEVASAPARWFAELFGSDPGPDQVAAYGRALLACKSHFRFQPPDFQVFSAETVQKRLAEQKAREEREALIAGGAAFFRLLWDVACKKRALPSPDAGGACEWPAPEVAERLRTLLYARMTDPESQEHETLWRMLSKGLPDVPHLPLQLLVAWGELPPHYNFWLDRADYAPGDAWWRDCAQEVDALEQAAGSGPEAADLPFCDLPFVSIDSASTRDVDDAFFVQREGACELFVARARLAANLTYRDSQAVLDRQDASGALPPDNPAAPYAELLRLGLDLARRRQAARISDGAVIMDRPDPVIRLEGQGADLRVDVLADEPAPDAQMLVAEMMILASAAVARWAQERGLAMLHRTQDVALPREYAGVWTAPQDMARIMRALTPSRLEVQARPHAALGLARYTPVTSPLRRYPDLVNEAQVAHFLRTGRARWDERGLEELLNSLSPVLEAVGQVQRFRPRYWKLLFFRQKGDKLWWPGVITEENDAFVSVSLPDQGLFVRGRRRMFDERACPGMAVEVRLGKAHPLYNEIQILEAATVDG
ncbi:RNB domain-containing ribonuclease [uncultured Desulfovibrio sp.]|uniref:RNB domain-containing ribonuclease n=1 Tax=uncultured Desulfovibrio sp. TaxID=167968 RepID=UPI0026057445|nr:RNB domain-containing ribonuclease [uncultured Desulfovibrio sp.]